MVFQMGGFTVCFFFKQNPAYEMRISDWSSDVCSSDLPLADLPARDRGADGQRNPPSQARGGDHPRRGTDARRWLTASPRATSAPPSSPACPRPNCTCISRGRRSEEHTSELQSLMRISYAVFCLKKKTKQEQQSQ